MDEGLFSEVHSEPDDNKPIKEFSISYLPSNLLLPHEQIIKQKYNQVLQNIAKTGILRKPLLVSQEYVILDGHHRFAALKKLNINSIPVIVVNYLDDSLIKLGAWYPTLNIKPRKLKELLNLHNYKTVSFHGTVKEGLRLNEGKIVFGNVNEWYQVSGEKEPIFSIIFKGQKNVQYVDSISLVFQMNNTNTAVLFASYTKEVVLQTAQNHNPLLPKSTRHILTYQFPDFNFKINSLNYT